MKRKTLLLAVLIAATLPILPAASQELNDSVLIGFYAKARAYEAKCPKSPEIGPQGKVLVNTAAQYIRASGQEDRMVRYAMERIKFEQVVADFGADTVCPVLAQDFSQ